MFSSFPNRKCYLSNTEKIQEVQTECLKFQHFLTPAWWSKSQKDREQWAAHTASPKRHKCSNWRARVTQMTRHRQKVNYKAEDRKGKYGRYGRIHTVSAETVSAGMSLLSCSNNKSSVLIQYINRNDPSLSSRVFSEKVQFHPLMETLPTSPMIWNDYINHGPLLVPGSSLAVFCIKRHNH